MRTALPLVVLIVLAGCDAAASKPKRAASTSKARPPASLPLVSRPEPSAESWLVLIAAVQSINLLWGEGFTPTRLVG